MPASTPSLIALCLTAACVQGPPAARAAPEQAIPAVDSSARAPLLIKWVVRAEEPQRVSLIAEIRLLAPTRLPLAVNVDLPPGVVLASGRPSFEVPPQAAPEIVREPYVVTFVSRPEGDLLLRADMGDTGFGVHAKDSYRFGRPAPVTPVPVANGPHAVFNGIDLGPSVPIDPQKR